MALPAHRVSLVSILPNLCMFFNLFNHHRSSSRGISSRGSWWSSWSVSEAPPARIWTRWTSSWNAGSPGGSPNFPPSRDSSSAIWDTWVSAEWIRSASHSAYSNASAWCRWSWRITGNATSTCWTNHSPARNGAAASSDGHGNESWYTAIDAAAEATDGSSCYWTWRCSSAYSRCCRPDVRKNQPAGISICNGRSKCPTTSRGFTQRTTTRI
ncbi:hypothetical protein BJ742DRAFT_47264 [Cladochytrium replicatum]|nr:hypothetical protein BJ742DRAFT_47264 [Cladochytrium replicatum]